MGSPKNHRRAQEGGGLKTKQADISNRAGVDKRGHHVRGIHSQEQKNATSGKA